MFCWVDDLKWGNTETYSLLQKWKEYSGETRFSSEGLWPCVLDVVDGLATCCCPDHCVCVKVLSGVYYMMDVWTRPKPWCFYVASWLLGPWRVQQSIDRIWHFLSRVPVSHMHRTTGHLLSTCIDMGQPIPKFGVALWLWGRAGVWWLWRLLKRLNELKWYYYWFYNYIIFIYL